MTVMQFGAIVGPLLAGVMLHWVDLSTLYLIDAITCMAPIWATFRLAPMPPTTSEQGSTRWGFAAVLDGFRYLAGNKVVLMSFVVDLIAMILGMPRALFPQMAHESFGGPVEGGTTMALLAAAMSAGAVAGGVFSGWLPRIRRQGLAVVVAIVVWGVAMVGFGLVTRAGRRSGPAPFLWIALVFLAFGGAADMVSAAFRSTILQQAASDDVRGRLQGVFIVVVAGGPRLADAAHGAAAAAVGTTVAAAGGGALVVVGVVIAALVVPAFVRYRVAERTNDRAATKCDGAKFPSLPLAQAPLTDLRR